MECRVRRLLNLPNTTHTWLLGPLLDSVHMTYKLYIPDLKFIYCMKNNDNDLVSSCFEYVSNNANSILGNKIIYFREEYNNNNNNNCLKSNIQCIEIRVQWTVHLGSSHMHVHAVTRVHAVTPKLVICVMYLTSI